MTKDQAADTADTTSTPKVYAVDDIAKLLGCGVRTVWRMTDAGKIPGRLKLSNRLVRFSKKTVDAWLEGGAK